MDKIAKNEKCVIELLNEITTHVEIAGEELHDEILIDTQRRHYCLLWVGFQEEESFVDKILVHLQIKADGKIWILANWTENQLANLLEEKGVDKKDIVIGFHTKYERAFTKYSVG